MARPRGDPSAPTSRGTQGPARSDAYTGLLLLSLLAQIVGVVFFYLDHSQYPTPKPQVPAPPTLSSPGMPAPAVPPGGPPPMGGAVPPMGGGQVK